MNRIFGYIVLILLVSECLQSSQVQSNEYSEAGRVRRQAPELPDNVIELVLITDYAAFQFFSSLDSLQGATAADVSAYMLDYLKSLTRDVDTMFEYLTTYSRLNIRLHFLAYQIAETKFQSSWTKGNKDSDRNLKADEALHDLTAYMDFLVTQLGFPEPDHVIGLTKLPVVNIPGPGKFIHGTPICTTSGTMSTSVIEMDENLPRYIAQVLALSLGADYDNNTDCRNSAQYIMSDIYTENSAPAPINPYKFSPCSRESMRMNINGLETNCMKSFDPTFDYETFLQTLYVGEAYTVDEQCQHVLGKASSKCTIGVDCQGLDCLDPDTGMCVNVMVGVNTTCDESGMTCSFGVCGEFVPNTTVTTSTTTSSTSSTSSTTTATVTPPPPQPIDLGDVSIDIDICDDSIFTSSPLPSSVFVFSSELPPSIPPMLPPIALGDVNIDINIACGGRFL